MGIFKYPYTDLHELNLDMILLMIKELDHEMDDFVAANKITNAGAWDITKQYQAWTIVSDNNVGYISLKPVPVGIAITNNEYWGVIADYNILITDLSNRITTLENNVATLNLVTIPRIVADEMIFLGDSYGVDATAGGKAWSSFVADIYPDAYINCVGGMGFASDMYLSQNFLSMLQNMTIPDPYKIKSIFIFAGANDANLINDGTATESDIEARIIAFSNYVKTYLPNAVIYLSFIGWNKNSNKFPAYTSTYKVYSKTASECSNTAYINGLESIMKNDDYIDSLDMIHPVAAASETLAQYIIEIIKTKADVLYYKKFDTSITKDASISYILGLSASKGIIYDGDLIKIIIFGTQNANMNIDIRPSGNITAGPGDYLTIGTCSNSPRSGEYPLTCYQTAILHDTSNVSHEVPVKMFLYGRNIMMQFLQTTSYDNINQILLMSPLILEGYTF